MRYRLAFRYRDGPLQDLRVVPLDRMSGVMRVSGPCRHRWAGVWGTEGVGPCSLTYQNV
jgi:hypothetical protein